MKIILNLFPAFISICLCTTLNAQFSPEKQAEIDSLNLVIQESKHARMMLVKIILVQRVRDEFAHLPLMTCDA